MYWNFLILPENEELKESTLEKNIINNLQAFLLEVGKGFSFVARQFRISTETTHFYIDLVFYNYILKCFVIIDLKTGKLTHQNIGQMDMYVRMFDDLKRGEDDNPTIGIILCSDKEDTVVNDNDEGVVLHKIGPFFLKQSSLSVDSIPEKVKAAFRRRAFEQIIKILEKEQVELILSFYLLNAGYLAQFAARELGIPHIAGIRGNDIGRNIFNVERFAVIQWIVHNSNKLEL